jgi:AcrR family transcriptional regulator
MPIQKQRRSVSAIEMARTQSPDYDKRREAILNQAARLYARRGFLGASVADLATACGASKSLIYHYYPSKEDILFAVMSGHLEELMAIREEVMEITGLSAEERLRRLTLGFVKSYVGAAANHKVLLNELDNLPSDKRKVIVTRQRELVVGVEALLLEIRPELGEHEDLHRPVTMLYFGMINWMHTWFRLKGPVSAKQLATVAMDLLMNGIRDVDFAHYRS